MTGFLLDVHLPTALVDAVRRLVPDVRIEHLARWEGGGLRTAADEDILAAAAAASMILVTCDVHTVQPLAERWVLAGRAFPGVVFIVGTRVTEGSVGPVASALVQLHQDSTAFDPSYPVVYLQLK